MGYGLLVGADGAESRVRGAMFAAKTRVRGFGVQRPLRDTDAWHTVRGLPVVGVGPWGAWRIWVACGVLYNVSAVSWLLCMAQIVAHFGSRHMSRLTHSNINLKQGTHTPLRVVPAGAAQRPASTYPWAA